MPEPLDITFLEHDACRDHLSNGGLDIKQMTPNHSILTNRVYGDVNVQFNIHGGKRALRIMSIRGQGWELIGQFGSRCMSYPDANGYVTTHPVIFYLVKGNRERFLSDFTLMSLIADRGDSLDTPGEGNLASAKHILFFNEEDYDKALAQNKSSV